MPSSVAPVTAPLPACAVMRRARFLTDDSRALSNLPVIKLAVKEPPKVPTMPSAVAAVSAAFSSTIWRAVLGS